VKLTEIIPKKDLLDQLDGVESGLRRLGFASTLAWSGGIVAIVLQIVAVAYDDWGLAAAFDPAKTSHWAYLIIAAFGLVGFAAALSLRLRLRESKRPFRYTASVEDFTVVVGEDSQKPSSHLEPKLGWLGHDLAQKLNERVQRLFFTETGNQTIVEARIHVRGHYIIRRRLNSESTDRSRDSASWELVVMPRVRVGDKDAPERLARPFPLMLKKAVDKKTNPVAHEDTKPSEGAAGESTTDPNPPNPDEAPPELDARQYGKLAERVYFSVASEIYQQIRRDVEQKIDLLPTRYLKAVAVYHEANDYARSNTLHAYQAASELYLNAARLFDPFDPLLHGNPSFTPRFLARRVRRALFTFSQFITYNAARVAPSLTKPLVLLARSKIGHANMLLFRGSLSGLLGQRSVSVYAARPFLESALHDLKYSAEDTPGHADTSFDLYSSLALCMTALADHASAAEHLKEARSRNLERARRDPVYLLADSRCDIRPVGTLDAPFRSRLETLIRAVETDNRFELALFDQAYNREMLWRTGPSPIKETAEAKLVIRDYDAVSELNPGNLASWANSAYLKWLLASSTGSPEMLDAEDRFQYPRDFRSFIPETDLAELHYGLVRINAERGDFDSAYEYLISAENARRAHGLTHGFAVAQYFFALIGPDILARFTCYRDAVLSHFQANGDKSERNSHRMVAAFVENEYGEACTAYYRRTGLPEHHTKAREAFEHAVEIFPDYVMAHYNLALIDENPDAAAEHLDQAINIEPDWPDARLEHSRRLASSWSVLVREATDIEEKVMSIQRNLDTKTREERGFTVTDIVPINTQHEIAQHASASPDRTPTKHEEALAVEAARLTEEAALKRGKADDVLKKALRHPRTLLPHRWLWRHASPAPGQNGGGQSSDFNWGSISNARYHDEARWEREFDSLHVQALYAWALPLLLDEQAPQRKEKFNPFDFSRSRHNVRELITLLKSRFVPADFSVLLDLHTLSKPGEEQTALAEQLRNVVRARLTKDPAAHWALSWATARGFTLPTDERLPLLRRAIHLSQGDTAIKPMLATALVEHADELFSLDDFDNAKKYYEELLELPQDLDLAAARLKLFSLDAQQGKRPNQDLLDTMADDQIRGEIDDALSNLAKKSIRVRLQLLSWYETFIREQDPSGEVIASPEPSVLSLAEAVEQREYRRREAIDESIKVLLLTADEVDRICAVSDTTELASVPVPVRLGIHPSLIDMLDSDAILAEVTEMRNRIEKHYGVRIPGVRVFEIDYEVPLVYDILIHEARVQAGTNDDIAKYFTGTDVRRKFAAVARILEDLLISDLPQWLGLQEVQNLMERNLYDAYQKDVIGFETFEHIGRFSAVLKTLADERTPIVDIVGIHALFIGANRDVAPNAIAESARRLNSIKDKLWGLSGPYLLCTLSDPLEELLRSLSLVVGGIITGAPDIFSHFRDAVRFSTERIGRPVAVIVKDPALRLPLRTVLRESLPNVPVLSRDELPADRLQEITGVIESAPTDGPNLPPGGSK
jgi:tetratricopeptide (TPR) repeat protein